MNVKTFHCLLIIERDTFIIGLGMMNFFGKNNNELLNIFNILKKDI